MVPQPSPCGEHPPSTAALMLGMLQPMPLSVMPRPTQQAVPSSPVLLRSGGQELQGSGCWKELRRYHSTHATMAL